MKILVVVASILVKIRYAEVGKGFLSTVFVQKLADPECNSNLVQIWLASVTRKGNSFKLLCLALNER